MEESGKIEGESEEQRGKSRKNYLKMTLRARQGEINGKTAKSGLLSVVHFVSMLGLYSDLAALTKVKRPNQIVVCVVSWHH